MASFDAEKGRKGDGEGNELSPSPFLPFSPSSVRCEIYADHCPPVNPPNCECHPWVSEETVRRVIREATLVLLPSHAEALPTVLLEAAACGTPFVASNVAGTPDIVEQSRAGLLHEVGDPEGMRKAIERLLTDDGLWEECSRNGPCWAKSLDVSNIVPQWQRLYAQLGIVPVSPIVPVGPVTATGTMGVIGVIGQGQHERSAPVGEWQVMCDRPDSQFPRAACHSSQRFGQLIAGLIVVTALAGALRFYKLGDWSFEADEISALIEEQVLFHGRTFPKMPITTISTTACRGSCLWDTPRCTWATSCLARRVRLARRSRNYWHRDGRASLPAFGSR